MVFERQVWRHVVVLAIASGSALLAAPASNAQDRAHRRLLIEVPPIACFGDAFRESTGGVARSRGLSNPGRDVPVTVTVPGNAGPYVVLRVLDADDQVIGERVLDAATTPCAELEDAVLFALDLLVEAHGAVPRDRRIPVTNGQQTTATAATSTAAVAPALTERGTGLQGPPDPAVEEPPTADQEHVQPTFPGQDGDDPSVAAMKDAEKWGFELAATASVGRLVAPTIGAEVAAYLPVAPGWSAHLAVAASWPVTVAIRPSTETTTLRSWGASTALGACRGSRVWPALALDICGGLRGGLISSEVGPGLQTVDGLSWDLAALMRAGAAIAVTEGLEVVIRVEGNLLLVRPTLVVRLSSGDDVPVHEAPPLAGCLEFGVRVWI